MNFKIAAHTDVGTGKQTNQDSYCFFEAQTPRGNVLFAAVCDGMGGLAKGELASAVAVRELTNWFETELPKKLGMNSSKIISESRLDFDRLLKTLNSRLREYGANHHLDLGTTASLFLVLEDGAYLITHVGDSRVYRLSGGLFQLTDDQTLVALEVSRGNLTPEQAERDPRRSVLLQCVGASSVLEPTCYTGRVIPGEGYLLCSDGFRHELSPGEISACLDSAQNEAEMTAALAQLTRQDIQRGETDNITAVYIKVE